jgi:CHASE3 domain sensor protein
MIQSKRVALSLKPDIDAVISELSELTKTTKTSIIQGILLEMLPMLKATTKSIKLAQAGKDSAAIAIVQELMVNVGEQLDTATLDMFEMKKKVDANGK